MPNSVAGGKPGSDPSAGYSVPPAPAYAGDPVPYGVALDEWLIQLRQLSDDPAWLEWYRAMHDLTAVAVDVPPHPGPDCKDTGRWWRAFNRAYREAGASADGIFDAEDAKPEPPRARRRRSRRVVRRMIRREIEAAIPSIVAATAEALRGQ